MPVGRPPSYWIGTFRVSDLQYWPINSPSELPCVPGGGLSPVHLIQVTGDLSGLLSGLLSV